MGTRWLLLGTAIGVCCLTAGADDWPQFRGPTRDNKVTGFTPLGPRPAEQRGKAPPAAKMDIELERAETMLYVDFKHRISASGKSVGRCSGYIAPKLESEFEEFSRWPEPLGRANFRRV